MINVRRIQTTDTEHVKSLISGIMDKEFAKVRHAYQYHDLEDPCAHYAGPRQIFLVAEKDGKIIGTAAIKEENADTALLRRIFVHKDYRGKGFGDVLLGKAMEFCFEHNYKTVKFRATDKMQESLQFCIRNGFEKENETKDGDFNIVVFSKRL
jgi:N-acetylglutamate synthase-like GNAT family acetyltransferase